MPSNRHRLDAFNLGQGIEPEQHVCAECGYVHASAKNFRKMPTGEGVTCSTGHYEDRDGNLKRARNVYARH
jgi:transposase